MGRLVLDMISGFAILGFEAVVLIVYLDIFFKRKYHGRAFVPVVVLSETVLYAVYSYFVESTLLLMMFSIISIVTIALVGYKGKPVSKILAAVLYWIILNILDYVVALGLIHLASPDVAEWLSDSNNRIIISVITKMFLLITVVIIRHRWSIRKDGLVLPADELVFLIIFPLSSVINITIMTYVYSQSYVVSSGTIIYAIFIFASNIALFWFITASARRKKTVLDNEMLEQKLFYTVQEMNTLNKSQKELREQAHENKNILNTVYCLISENRSSEAMDYIQTITTQISENIHVVNTGNIYIDAILNHKYKEMRAKYIPVDFVVEDCSSITWLAPDDIVTIIGNALDNAAEASLRNTETMHVHIRVHNQKRQFIFSVSNYVDEAVDVNSFTRSTKEKDIDQHGFGLANVRKAASHYDSVCDLNYDNHYVTFIFMANQK